MKLRELTRFLVSLRLTEKYFGYSISASLKVGLKSTIIIRNLLRRIEINSRGPVSEKWHVTVRSIISGRSHLGSKRSALA
jgi:hypothetical protein